VSIRWSTRGNENNPMVEGAAKGIDIIRQTFPHVTVQAEPQVSTPDGPTWAEKNFAVWLAGTGPDVSGACCAILPDWGRQEIPTNLDALIKRDGKQVPLADKDLRVFIEPIKGDYSRPEQFYLKDAESKLIWTDAAAATFTRNEAPVSDTFRKAAQQINQLHQD
jgi:hypothetical protein